MVGVSIGCGSSPEWTRLPLYIESIDHLLSYDIIEVIRMSMSPGRKFVKRGNMGLSDKTQHAKDDLDADPYNMYCMNELAFRYASEGHLDKCCNVLMRGWKRASEIPDSTTRFHFLMKLCEVSFYHGQCRQAFAVLKDIQEPQDGRDYQLSYLVLSCRVYARSGDLQGALKAFQRAIEPEQFDHAVRIWSLVLVDFRKGGGYEPAREYMEKKAGDNIMFKHQLEILDGCVNQTNDNSTTGLNKGDVPMYIAVGGVLCLLLAFVYILYLLESWSLAGHKIAK